LPFSALAADPHLRTSSLPSVPPFPSPPLSTAGGYHRAQGEFAEKIGVHVQHHRIGQWESERAPLHKGTYAATMNDNVDLDRYRNPDKPYLDITPASNIYPRFPFHGTEPDWAK
jgi:hypothetical protein